MNEYKNHIKFLNRLFQTGLPYPKEIEPKVTLLIFGFDRDQQKGRLKTLILENENKYFSGIKVYTKGNIKNIILENLINAKTL